MSHTDKDIPYWVQVKRSRHPIEHTCYRTRYAPRECDAHLPVTASETWRYCSPPTDRDVESRGRWWAYNPGRRERRISYWKPERSRVRAAIARAGQNDDLLDTLDVERQHRHSPARGGYWD